MQDHKNFLYCTPSSRKLMKGVIQEEKKTHGILGKRGAKAALGDRCEARLASE